MEQITIVALVDVIGALSKQSLENCLFLVDNACLSEGKGTPDLKTACYPGQSVNWVVHAADVQTPVLIKSVSFLKDDLASSEAAPARYGTGGFGEAPKWIKWVGAIPCDLKPGVYPYRLELQMCTGVSSVFYADTASLNVLAP